VGALDTDQRRALESGWWVDCGACCEVSSNGSAPCVVVLVVVLYGLAAAAFSAVRHHQRVPQRWRLGTARIVLLLLAGPPPDFGATPTCHEEVLRVALSY